MKKKNKGLSAWQLAMMALGSVIGGSFFLGSAVAINAAGPAILISYILGGFIVYFILYALSEMTVANPGSGSFMTFASQSFGPGTGFVVGWVYWIGMILSMSSEATAVSILLHEWFSNISIPIGGTTIIAGVTLLNLLGADKLSKLANGLSAIKLLAILSFIIISFLLVTGIIPGRLAIGAGELVREPLMPAGIRGIAGSMLLVVFAYAGFEIIGLAASEAENPVETIPKAINYTVISLVGFYILSVMALLPLIPTVELNENISPMVAALNRWGITWAGSIINLVLITAILSASLASMFGIARMLRSLVDDGYAPKWLKDKKDVPHKAIVFSGISMLLGLGFGLLFPRIYLFLISASGFSLLFTYAVIMATHIKFRKKHGCPPHGKCQMPGFPYMSWAGLISMIVVILSMPLISGQGEGLVVGIIMIAIFSAIYAGMKAFGSSEKNRSRNMMINRKIRQSKLATEFSNELTDNSKAEGKKGYCKKESDCNKNK